MLVLFKVMCVLLKKMKFKNNCKLKDLCFVMVESGMFWDIKIRDSIIFRILFFRKNMNLF